MVPHTEHAAMPFLALKELVAQLQIADVLLHSFETRCVSSPESRIYEVDQRGLSCNLGSGVKLFVQFSWSIINNANCLENQTG